jgi:hypothetical protein
MPLKAPAFPWAQNTIGIFWRIKNVRKLDANTYSTAMRGYKYKLAHKRAGKDSWSTSYQGQRKRLIKLYQNIIHQLEFEEVEERKNKVKKKSTKKATSKKK